ncbi:MAG: tryptophan--tRNA ligase [Candidatus Nanohaloarchaeota archaeon QJJ-5]|nr:tryptophan--tRNA ligase [Candidatus Nanohaloarchaeota archaeon QJJ-5]
MPDIDPWGDIQVGAYKEKMERFGIDAFDDQLDKLPTKNRYMRRDIIYGHRDFGRVADAIANGDDFAMMTGLMPSGKFHFGHKMVADQIKYYQELGADVYVAVADIESYTTRNIPHEKAREIAIDQYLLNYIALGIDPENLTFYFQSDGSTSYHTKSKFFSKNTTQNEIEAIYGDITPGKVTAALTQVADILQPQFEENGGPKPTVVPIGTDQDPHMRFTRDIAARTDVQDFIKPSSTYHKFMRGLQGGKMSSSKEKSYIALSDPIDEAKQKIDQAKTGGKQSLEKHRKQGADVDEDMVYELLAFHLIEDDDRLNRIYREYDSGEMLSGELKQIAKDELETFLQTHQEKREQARDRLDAYRDL